MPDNRDDILMPAYAGPAFYNSPPASALPIPKFIEGSLSVAAASSNSKELSTKGKPVAYNSDTNSREGKRDESAEKEEDRSVHVKPKVTYIGPSSQVCIQQAFEKLEKRMRKRSILELQQRQKSIINRLTSGTQDRNSAIPAGARPKKREMQQLWTDQRIQAIGLRKADVVVMLKRSTNHLSQLAGERLEQNLDGIAEILQQKRDEVDGYIIEESHPANDQESLTSSMNETSPATTDGEIAQIDIEIDNYEFDYEAVVLPRNFIKQIANSQETAFEDGIGADQETLQAIESEAEEEDEDFVEFEGFDDEGYLSIGE